MREFLRKNPAIGVTAAILLIVAAVAFGIFGMRGGGPDIPTKAWFTTDDGKTLFADDKHKVAPFEKDGQQAVRAIVYRCTRHDKQFVNHLERYTPEAKQAAEAARAEGREPGPSVANGRQVKKPGVGDWVLENDMGKAMAVIIPRCPEGDNDQLEGVQP